MKKLTNTTSIRRIIIFLLLAAVVLIVPVFLNGYFQQIVIQIVMYAYLASAWNIVGGFAGQFSLGHALYVGIGAYTSTILYNTWGVSPWIGGIVGSLISVLFAIILGYPRFKLRSTYYTLTSLAICAVVGAMIKSVKYVGNIELGAARGLRISLISGNDFAAYQFKDKIIYYYIILAMLIIILLVCRWIKNSKMGYQLAAIANNQEAAESLCVNSRALKLKAAAISAFFCALGGTFYAQLILICNPSTLFGEALSDELVIISMIGGKGTLLGPTIGAILIRSLSQATTAIVGGSIPGLHLAIYGTLLVLCIRFFPDGVLSIITRTYKRIRKDRQISADGEGV